MTNSRGVGQRRRSRARLGTSSISPVAGPDDPRWDRNARQRSSDFVKGRGIEVDRNGRDRVAIGNERGNILRENERGELVVELPERQPSAAPGPVSVGAVSDPESAAAIVVLTDAVNRLQDILREQGVTR